MVLRARGCTHLLRICGVGPIVAAKILGETRGIGRFRNAAAYAAHTGTAPVPASSGRTQRHRLNRGGNRQLNRALYTIAMVQARWDPAARAYLDRKLAEGKSAAEARRCLKRHLANTVYRALVADLETRALDITSWSILPLRQVPVYQAECECRLRAALPEPTTAAAPPMPCAHGRASLDEPHAGRSARRVPQHRRIRLAPRVHG